MKAWRDDNRAPRLDCQGRLTRRKISASGGKAVGPSGRWISKFPSHRAHRKAHFEVSTSSTNPPPGTFMCITGTYGEARWDFPQLWFENMGLTARSACRPERRGEFVSDNIDVKRALQVPDETVWYSTRLISINARPVPTRHLPFCRVSPGQRSSKHGIQGIRFAGTWQLSPSLPERRTDEIGASCLAAFAPPVPPGDPPTCRCRMDRPTQRHHVCARPGVQRWAVFISARAIRSLTKALTCAAMRAFSARPR